MPRGVYPRKKGRKHIVTRKPRAGERCTVCGKTYEKMIKDEFLARSICSPLCQAEFWLRQVLG